MRLSAEDHARVSAAVAAAEARTDGEIVTIVAARSDAYHDAALQWAVLAMLLALALFAAVPGLAESLAHLWTDPWSGPPSGAALLMTALVVQAMVFLAVRYLLAWPSLRLALTPRSTKRRRARARALTLFRASAEHRTKAKTGVLLYLSMAEHDAEIIADAAIHDRVSPDVWGEAMAALIAAVKDGRPGDGMAAAVERIGAVLAEHFPRSEGDVNELPDRLIEL